MKSVGRFSFTAERASPEDPAFDFCLWPYVPPAPADSLSLRGVNLLYAAADLTGCLAVYGDLIARLRRVQGDFRTVWGVKNDAGQLSCEFYFYDYNRLERAKPFRDLAAAFAPLIEVVAPVDDQVPYFMASVELPLGDAPWPEVMSRADIYIGNPGSEVSSGICYQIGTDGAELKNFYFFFDAQADWDAFLTKAACSAMIPVPQYSPGELFPDWLRQARVAVIANKRRCDSVYFSGVGADALARFLEEFEYPSALGCFLSENSDSFAHLSFDVGFDYRVEDGRLRRTKSSFYNVL